MSEPTPEFSRPLRIDSLGPGARDLQIEASEEERAALARRFGLVAIDRLTANIALTRNGDRITVSGTMSAKVTQSCVASSEPVEAEVDAPFAIAFSPAIEGDPAEEIELSEEDCDMVFYSGAAIDIGEAVAETLSLNLDPWPRASNAEDVLRAAGVKAEHEVGPFAALAGLKDKLKGG
jgi:uncharacterized metal-binding protein YceD (DUF177 family)